MSEAPATDDDGQVATDATTSSAADRTHAPFLVLAAVIAILVPLRQATRPLDDVDLYWHLLVGQEILDGTPVAEAGRGWSFAPVADTWVSSQWLAEVLFAWMEGAFGFQSFVVYRTLTCVAALAVLALVTLRGRPARAGAWPFAVAGVAVALTGQERSQQLTYILAPLVGWWALRLWRDGRLPRWWLVLPLVAVWANVHGGWVLVPAVLVLAALARLFDTLQWRDRSLLGALALAAGSVLAAMISPSGVDNVVAIGRISSSAGLISEWGGVRLVDWQALPLGLMTATAVVAWALGRSRPPRGELLLVLPLVLFGYGAWRSMTPACLLLAPIVTGTLARALGDPDPLPEGVHNRLARTSLAAAAAGAVIGVALALTQSPVVNPWVPQQLLARLHDAPVAQRVLNTYNVAGPLLWFGGPPPHVVVGIDGRADRYGADYIGEYADDLIGARPGWEELFDQLAPTTALLHDDEALAGVLVAQRGWIEVAHEGGFVLLRAPDAPGWG